MARTQSSSHPFALLIDPQSVIQAIEKSQRLEALQRRVCRPLDKPLLPVMGGAQSIELDDEEDLTASDDQFDIEACSALGLQTL
jgi:hypothetical protein